MIFQNSTLCHINQTIMCNKLFMQIQSKQQKQRKEYSIFYAKGSGSSACLLTNKLDDEPQFIKFEANNMLIKQIDIAGLYMMAIVEVQEEKQSENKQKQQQKQKLETSQDIQQKLEIQFKRKGIKNKEMVVYWGNVNDKLLHNPQIIKMSEKILIDSISCGWNHSLIKSKDGILFGFGENKFGQLGVQNPQKFYLEPILVVPVSNNDRFVGSFKAGFRQSYWQTYNKNIYGCGQSKNYELSQLNKKNLIASITLEYEEGQNQIGKQHRVTKFSCGKRFLMLVLQNNELYGLGSNDYSCLTSESNIPYFEKITFIQNNVKDVECGWNHVLLQDMNGMIWTRGRNNFGQLGTSQNVGENKKFYKVQLPQSCQKIKAGTQFNFVKGQSGTLYGWGWNEHLNIDTDDKNVIIQRPKVIKSPEKLGIEEIYTHSAITILKVSHNF